MKVAMITRRANWGVEKKASWLKAGKNTGQREETIALDLNTSFGQIREKGVGNVIPLFTFNKLNIFGKIHVEHQ
jgi:hypothetical protein